MAATVSYPGGVNININGELVYNNRPNNGDLLVSNSFGLASWTSSSPMLANIYNTDGGLTGSRIMRMSEYPLRLISTASSAYFEVTVGGSNGILLGKDPNSNQSSRLFFSNGNVGEHSAILNSGNNIDFRTNATSGNFSGNQRMVINSSGNVGINQVIIDAKLHVTSGSTQSGILVNGNTSADLLKITQTGTGNALLVEDSNPDSTPVVIDSSGNVGIGTSSASHLLTLGKDGGISIYGSSSGFVYIKSRSNVISWTASLPPNKGYISNFIYNNFGGEIMLNDGQGNLYFGTTPSLYLPESYVFIGNTYSYAIGRGLSGDIRNDYTGVVTIQPGVVSYSKMQTMTQKAVLGTINVSGGNVTELPLYNSYISIGVASTALENAANWTGVSYTGPAITGTFQGQNHYNGSYFYTAVDDNLWIRFSRV
jgi:hypothetical protein